MLASAAVGIDNTLVLGKALIAWSDSDDVQALVMPGGAIGTWPAADPGAHEARDTAASCPSTVPYVNQRRADGDQHGPSRWSGRVVGLIIRVRRL